MNQQQPEHPEPTTGENVGRRVDSATEPTRPLADGGAPTWQDTATGADTSGVASRTPDWGAEEQAGRRRLSVSHLVMGLVFLGISGLWLAQETGAVAVDDLDLLVPLLLVVVGAAGLVAGLARAVRDRP